MTPVTIAPGGYGSTATGSRQDVWLSLAGVSKAICFASLCCATLPEFASAQSAVVRHSVVAEVVPVVSVRDSTWSAPQEIGAGTQTTWSGEISANTASELQVLGPREADQTGYARAVGGGQWERLTAGAWHTVAVTPVGRRVVTFEVLVVAPNATAPGLPPVRVVHSRPDR
jgi:hypothetical protein